MLTVALLAVLLGGCTSVGDSQTGPTTVSATPDSPAVSTAVLMAAHQAVDRFNATAGGSVAAQQTVLDAMISPGQLAVQHRCPGATSTIALDPVYARLAPAPDWRPTEGTLPGVVYQLPTLIRIYTGDRRTATDLTDLHLTIDSSAVRLPALCLG